MGVSCAPSSLRPAHLCLWEQGAHLRPSVVRAKQELQVEQRSCQKTSTLEATAEQLSGRRTVVGSSDLFRTSVRFCAPIMSRSSTFQLRARDTYDERWL